MVPSPAMVLLRRVWAHRGALVALGTLVYAVAIFHAFEFTDLDRTALDTRGEDIAGCFFLVLAGVVAELRAFVPERRRDGTLRTFSVLWVFAWAVWSVVRDPAWAPSGIDWHDSYFVAYALKFHDPQLSCSARYPLYPALAVALSTVTGLSLAVALQLVSRAAMLSLVVPLGQVGRALFGTTGAIAGLLALVFLPTFHLHLDATTPYPLAIAATAWCVYGLHLAWRGRTAGSFVYGGALAVLLATDPKGLLVALATLPLAVLAAVFGPARRPVLARALRGIGLVVPIVVSYQWMGSLAVVPQTLEQLSSNALYAESVPIRDRDRTTAAGYLWGHFHGADQVLRTLQTFRAADEDPALAPAHALARRNTPVKAKLDYPGSSLRLLGLVALGLVAGPLLAVRTPRRAGLRALDAVSVLAVGTTAVPSLLQDYQDRYLAHALVWGAMLCGGAMDAVARVVVGDGPGRGHARLLAVGGTLVAALVWPGFPLSYGRIQPRLDAVLAGGTAELAVQSWADATMHDGDVLLDGTWLAMGLLAAGDHVLLRQPTTYPPSNATIEGPGWRRSAPDTAFTGTFYVLVANSGEPPAPGGVRYTVDTVRASPDFEKVWTSDDTFLEVYRYVPSGLPPGVQVPVRADE